MVFQVELKGVSTNFKGVSRVYEGSLKSVSVKFQWCFNGVSRVCKGFKEVSKKFQGYLKVILRKFQGCFKED